MSQNKGKKSTRRARAEHQARENRNLDPRALLGQVQELWKAGQTVRAREGARRLFRDDPEKHRDLFFSRTVEAVKIEAGMQRYDQACAFSEQAPGLDDRGSLTRPAPEARE